LNFIIPLFFYLYFFHFSILYFIFSNIFLYYFYYLRPFLFFQPISFFNGPFFGLLKGILQTCLNVRRFASQTLRGYFFSKIKTSRVKATFPAWINTFRKKVNCAPFLFHNIQCVTIPCAPQLNCAKFICAISQLRDILLARFPTVPYLICETVHLYYLKTDQLPSLISHHN